LRALLNQPVNGVKSHRLASFGAAGFLVGIPPHKIEVFPRKIFTIEALQKGRSRDDSDIGDAPL
jgi:hypothetical protein